MAERSKDITRRWTSHVEVVPDTDVPHYEQAAAAKAKARRRGGIAVGAFAQAGESYATPDGRSVTVPEGHVALRINRERGRDMGDFHGHVDALRSLAARDAREQAETTQRAQAAATEQRRAA